MMRALAYRDYRILLAATTVAAMAMPVQFLTIIFWIQDAFPDRQVLYVSLVSASRGVALLGMSLLGGAIADRFNRRRVLLGVESVAAAITLLTGLAIITTPGGEASMALILLLVFLSSANTGIDAPARSASMPAIVGMEDLSSAISLNMVAQQLVLPLMLPFVGLLNDQFDSGVVFLASLAAWGIILPLMLSLRYNSTGGGTRGATVVQNIRQGLAHTRRDSVLVGVFGLVLAMHLLAMPGVGMLGALWMTKVLDLSPSRMGVMGALWGVGSLAGAILLALLPRLLPRGQTLSAFAVAFAVAAVIFGHSRNLPLTGFANFVLGAGIGASMMAASTIVQRAAPEALRGRVMGLFPLIMGLSMLNALPVGLAGQRWSIEVMVPLMSWVSLVAVVAIIALRPALRGGAPHPPAFLLDESRASPAS